jgi:hypothetical protein
MSEDEAYTNIKSVYRQHDKKRIRQGDILRDFDFIEWRGFVGANPNKVKLRLRALPYVILLTQDCDLDLDFTYHTTKQKDDDKFLQSILACPAYLAEQFRKGKHLEEIGLQMAQITSDRWHNITYNSDPRYHFLPASDTYGMPPVVVDFKHYYGVHIDMLYDVFDRYYHASLNELFREELSQRFSAFLSRVGVPRFK